jgi:hypothetical protein
MGILIHLAKRWVAGEYLEDAIKRATLKLRIWLIIGLKTTTCG